MIIKSQNFVLKLEEILKEDLPTERYNELEKFVLNLIRSWHSGQKSFTHQTSGSTGRPKKIEISRDKIELSAKATLSFVDPAKKLKSSLLCLNPQHIGGAMVVYRALIFQHHLTISEPTSSPLTEFDESDKFDLVSMAPLQFNNLTESEINRFKVILVGGAPMPILESKFAGAVYSTFGMTETVSHIALRAINDSIFKTAGDTVIKQDVDDSLMLKGSITNNKWLKTNDIIEFIDSNTFRWIGRKDFIINSGGIKINPEALEEILRPQFDDLFMVTYLPDSDLGRKVIILACEPPKTISFSTIDKYHAPKEVFWNQSILKTASGKIDRLRTQEHFEKSL